LRSYGGICRRGGDFDRYDLCVTTGIFGGARLQLAIEEHGGGKQLLRFRTWPVGSLMSLLIALALLTLAVAAELDENQIIALIFGCAAVLTGVRVGVECGGAAGAVRAAIRALQSECDSFPSGRYEVWQFDSARTVGESRSATGD
jgi:hypothetical protein